MSSAESLLELQKAIFDNITNNKTEELCRLLIANKVCLDIIDENGMSPLQHACYKGNKEIAQMLLDRGASINLCQHMYEYTALHFAALSGNADLCLLLMSYGANLTSTNSMGRTAAQMAAFVGNRNCVVRINTFIPKTYLNDYIRPEGKTEPMLHTYIAQSFYAFIMQINVNPIRVVLNLQHLGLINYLPMTQKVLEAMRQRKMSENAETNEVMAFKFHYLSCVVAEVIKCYKQQGALKAEKNDDVEGSEEKKSDVIELLIKKFLKPKSDGTQEYEEFFLKETVREFQYRNSRIFRQMVAILASPHSPCARSVITEAINGPQVFDYDSQICVTCGEEKATKKCSKCKFVQYCDRECQRLHWFIHKKTCNR